MAIKDGIYRIKTFRRKRILNRPALTSTQRISLILGACMTLGIFMRWTDLLITVHPQSSISLYAAERFLAGDIPYVDVWYNMMPGTLLCNAAALAAAYSIKSVLVFEILSMAAGGTILYFAMLEAGATWGISRIAGLWLAAAGVALSYISGANGAAEWALPAISIFVFLIVRAQRTIDITTAFLAGLAGGSAILFSPREAALILPGLIILRKYRGAFATGFFIVPIMFLLTLAVSGLTNAFNESFTQYNIAVLRDSGFFAIASVKDLPVILAALAFFAPVAGYFLFRAAPGGADNNIPDSLRRLRKGAAVWAVVEIVITIISGFGGATDLLFIMVPLIVVWSANARVSVVHRAEDLGEAVLTILFFLSFLVFSAYCARQPMPRARAVTDELNPQRAELLTKLVRIRVKDDRRFLVWSKSAATYFLSRRESATRYPSLIPLFTPGYSTGAIENFMADLNETKPDVLVLETSLIPEVVGEYIEGIHAAAVTAEQKPLFDFMTQLVRDGFRVSAVRGGVILCIRKPVER